MDFPEHKPTNKSSVLYAMNVTLNAVTKIKTLINQEAKKLDPSVLSEISAYLGDLEALLNNQMVVAQYESSSQEAWDEDEDAIRSGWGELNQRITDSQQGYVA